MASERAQAAELLLLPPARVAVVLVDFQNDFCSPAADNGPVTNIHNAQAAVRANAFAAEAQGLGARVIYTQQILDWPALPERQRRWEIPDGLCAAGTWGAELFITPIPGSTTVVKHRFDVWQSAAFVRELDGHDIDGLIICGVELVCCVLHAILGASERGYHYLVPTDLVSGQDFGDTTDNRAVRDYLRFNQPHHLTESATLLEDWRRHLAVGTPSER